MYDHHDLTVEPGRQELRRPAQGRRPDASLVISVACPTEGCHARLRFGRGSRAGGLVTVCPACHQAYGLVRGAVERRVDCR